MSYSDLSTTYFSNGISKIHPQISLEFQNLKIDNNLTATNATIINFTGNNISFTGANLNNLTATNISNTNFTGTNLSFTNAIGAYLQMGNNTVIGKNSGNSTIISGSTEDTIIGRNAGVGAINSNNNTFIGDSAGNVCQNPIQNTFIGSAAGQKCITGTTRSVCLGAGAGANNSLMIDNIFIGDFCGNASSGSNSNNTVIGSNAYQSNVNGSNNTIMGMQSGKFITSGNDNTLLGYESGFANSLPNTGSQNILIGSASKMIIDGQNAISIGFNSQVGQNNVAVIGNNNITNILPGTGSTCDLGISYQPFNNIFVNNLTLNGSGSFTNVRSDSYYCSKYNPLTNNVPSSIMTINQSTGATSCAGLFNLHLHAFSGPSIVQSYSSQISFTSCCLTGLLTFFTMANNNPLSTVSNGTLSATISGTTNLNQFQILCTPASSITNTSINYNLNGYTQNFSPFSSVTFP